MAPYHVMAARDQIKDGTASRHSPCQRPRLFLMMLVSFVWHQDFDSGMLFEGKLSILSNICLQALASNN